MPALPLSDAGPYVAAAYLVFLALILVYVAIMASKLVRIERQVSELNDLAAGEGGETRAGGASGAAGGADAGAGDPPATTGPAGAGGSRDRVEAG